jgi:hypothetical protein
MSESMLDDNASSHYIQCICDDPEHTMIFSIIENDNSISLSASVHLTSDVWYIRIWYAIKYILGYCCRYGHFMTWELHSSNVEKLYYLVEHVYRCTPENMRKSRLTLAYEHIEKLTRENAELQSALHPKILTES